MINHNEMAPGKRGVSASLSEQGFHLTDSNMIDEEEYKRHFSGYTDSSVDQYLPHFAHVPLLPPCAGILVTGKYEQD